MKHLINLLTLNRASGFSLIEMVITLALGSLATVIFTQMQTKDSESFSAIRRKMDIIQAKQEALNLMLSPTSCFATLKDIIIPDYLTTGFISSNVNGLLQAKASLPGTEIMRIKSNSRYSSNLELADINLINVNAVFGKEDYVADMRISRRDDQNQKFPIIIKGIFFSVDTTTRKIGGCGHTLPKKSTNCSFDGTWFYFDGGAGNDFGITCHNNIITGFCGSYNGGFRGLKAASYDCEGSTF